MLERERDLLAARSALLSRPAPRRRFPHPALLIGAAALLLLIVVAEGAVDRGSRGGPALWLTPEEIAALPMHGAAWDNVKEAADRDLGPPAIADPNSKHDTNTLAVALVYARSGEDRYRDRAAAAIAAAIGTEEGGNTLALGRNLPGYVIAADLIVLTEHDPHLDARFRQWLDVVRTTPLDGRTLIGTHEERPNNWGTHAGAARIAADAYLGDVVDISRAAEVFRGWLGDRDAHDGFEYGDLSWQANPDEPVGVNPAGAVLNGQPVGGALPDDMRRGGPFAWPPRVTGYPWGGLQGALVQAELLDRQGYGAWEWEDRALLRAVQFLADLDGQLGGWWAQGDDTWQPWLVNDAYSASFPTTSPTTAGKNVGWTDWTHGAHGRGPQPRE